MDIYPPEAVDFANLTHLAVGRVTPQADGSLNTSFDIDPAKVGRDLGDIANVGRQLKVKVSDDARKTIKAAKPDVVVLCTSSLMKGVLGQVESILELRIPIVSTTEELAYPTRANMRYARIVHKLAKKAKVANLAAWPRIPTRSSGEPMNPVRASSR